MTAYAVANLRNVKLGPQIVEYLQRIDATLAPFGGYFIIHGGPKDIVEGNWVGDLVVVAFPDVDAVHGWYKSEAYQDILALRTDFSDSDIVIIDGVPRDHKATDVLG